MEDLDLEPDAPEQEDDRLALARLDLPGGGYVTWRDPEELSGRDVKRLRKALDAPGVGSATNLLYETAMVLLIDHWEIPGKPQLRTPQRDPKASDQLTHRQFRAIEKHLKPVVKTITRGADEDEETDDETPR